MTITACRRFFESRVRTSITLRDFVKQSLRLVMAAFFQQRNTVRSQIQFVMHPDDERKFAEMLLDDPSVCFVDGPRWPTQQPTRNRSLDNIGSYCIIWSTNDVAQLSARYIPMCNDWYCTSEYATLQFLRSEVEPNVLRVGRIAISTHYDLPDFPKESAERIDARFKSIRRHIKKFYRSSIVRWYNERVPRAPAGPKRSANPSDPDKTMWVGPNAIKWIRENPDHLIKHMTGCIGLIDGVG